MVAESFQSKTSGCNTFSGKSMLGQSGLYLVTDDKTVGYLSGYKTEDAFVVFDDEKKFFFIDSRYYFAVRKALPSSWEVVLGSQKEAFEYIAKQQKPLFVDYRYTNLCTYEKLRSLGVEVADFSAEITAMMIVKSGKELAYIKKACAIAEKAFKNTVKTLKVGVTEAEVATYLESEFKRLGASGTSFDTIVAFGANSAVPHHQTGNKKLEENTVVLMDFGCRYKGYCSDMTRTFFFGKPTKEFTAAYNSVLAAHLAAYEGIKEGMTGFEADKIARDSLAAAGLSKYFTHSLGHGIGVNIHEAPTLSPRGETPLKNGMVFSIEPGVYLNGKFGIRIEDTVCLKDGKVVTFMKVGKGLKTIKSK